MGDAGEKDFPTRPALKAEEEARGMSRGTWLAPGGSEREGAILP